MSISLKSWLHTVELEKYIPTSNATVPYDIPAQLGPHVELMISPVSSIPGEIGITSGLNKKYSSNHFQVRAPAHLPSAGLETASGWMAQVHAIVNTAGVLTCKDKQEKEKQSLECIKEMNFHEKQALPEHALGILTFSLFHFFFEYIQCAVCVPAALICSLV